MKNKYVSTRGQVVSLVKQRRKRYVYRNMKLARYAVSFEDVESMMMLENPQTTEEQSVKNFQATWQLLVDSKDVPADYRFLLKLHGSLMKGLNTGVKSEMSMDQIDQLHTMINQPTKCYTEVALDCLLYILGKRLFADGDVLVALMFANKIMMDHVCGIITISEYNDAECRRRLANILPRTIFRKLWLCRRTLSRCISAT